MTGLSLLSAGLKLDQIEFQGVTYFKIPLAELRADEPIDFPLYIHMVLNGSMVLCFSPKRIPTKKDLGRYAAKGMQAFACPVSHHPNWLKYKTSPGKKITAEQVKQSIAQASMDAAAKREALVNIGQKMIDILIDLADPKEQTKWNSVKECNEIVATIVEIGMATHEMKQSYESLVMMQFSEIEHSACVSTFAVIFALIIGHSDEKELAEIAMGGLLHDVGHGMLPPFVFDKSFNDFNATEQTLYREHAMEGAQVLQDFGPELPELVKTIVLQHHERFDGTGFPHKLRGMEIDARVQVVVLADVISDLLSGRLTGKGLDPSAALEYVRERQVAGQRLISHDLFETIYKSVLTSKEKFNLAAAAAKPAVA